MKNTAKIVAARLDEGGNAVEWKITAKTASGGQAGRNARRKARLAAKKVFGAWFFYKKPPTQAEVDVLLNFTA